MSIYSTRLCISLRVVIFDTFFGSSMKLSLDLVALHIRIDVHTLLSSGFAVSRYWILTRVVDLWFRSMTPHQSQYGVCVHQVLPHKPNQPTHKKKKSLNKKIVKNTPKKTFVISTFEFCIVKTCFTRVVLFPLKEWWFLMEFTFVSSCV